MTEPTDAVAVPPFRTLAESASAPARHDMRTLYDIPVRLTVEIGRTRLPIGKLLGLAQGAVLELDGAAGDALDVRVNGCLIARGEAVMVGDKLGVRLTEVVATDERLARLQP